MLLVFLGSFYCLVRILTDEQNLDVGVIEILRFDFRPCKTSELVNYSKMLV